jgi:Tol biopolymer transport system component
VEGGEPRVFLKTEFAERWAQFSPDGRWVAYVSNEEERQEIYVRPFVHASGSDKNDDRIGWKWKLSTEGGVFPRWRHDGKALYYIGPNGQMMAVPISVEGDKLQPGLPIVQFQTRIVNGGVDAGPRHYDVAADGRFLINTVMDTVASPITLIQNWQPPIK